MGATHSDGTALPLVAIDHLCLLIRLLMFCLSSFCSCCSTRYRGALLVLGLLLASLLLTTYEYIINFTIGGGHYVAYVGGSPLEAGFNLFLFMLNQLGTFYMSKVEK